MKLVHISLNLFQLFWAIQFHFMNGDGIVANRRKKIMLKFGPNDDDQTGNYRINITDIQRFCPPLYMIQIEWGESMKKSNKAVRQQTQLKDDFNISFFSFWICLSILIVLCPCNWLLNLPFLIGIAAVNWLRVLTK